MEIILALDILNNDAAMANHRLGKMDERRLQVISQVCDEILEGKLDAHFPLAVWQTGSGTQSNMNVNEVIAGRGTEIAGEKLISRMPLPSLFPRKSADGKICWISLRK